MLLEMLVSSFHKYGSCRSGFRGAAWSEENILSLTDFSMPVHKSFHQASLLLGIPKTVFLILFFVFVLVSYLFGVVLGAVLTVVIYIPCFILTKHDPHMLTVALNSLVEPDRLEG